MPSEELGLSVTCPHSGSAVKTCDAPTDRSAGRTAKHSLHNSVPVKKQPVNRSPNSPLSHPKVCCFCHLGDQAGNIFFGEFCSSGNGLNAHYQCMVCIL